MGSLSAEQKDPLAEKRKGSISAEQMQDAMAVDYGMEAIHAQRLLQFVQGAYGKRLLAIVRETNKKSLVWHSDPLMDPKPSHLKYLKSSPELGYLEHKGHRYYADYDLEGVYEVLHLVTIGSKSWLEQWGDAAWRDWRHWLCRLRHDLPPSGGAAPQEMHHEFYYVPVFTGNHVDFHGEKGALEWEKVVKRRPALRDVPPPQASGTLKSSFIRKLNQFVCRADKPMFQHGSQDEYRVKNIPLLDVKGRFLAFEPDGQMRAIRSPAHLRRYYDELGIPWMGA